MNALRIGLVALLSLAACTAVHAGAVVVGKHSALAVMDAEQARRIFLCRVPTIDGRELTVIYQEPGRARTEFETHVLGMTGAELNTYLARLIFTGEIKPPLEAADDAAVKLRVNAAAGAIGYIQDDAVDATVRVLFRY